MPDNKSLLLTASVKPEWVDPVTDALHLVGYITPEDIDPFLSADISSAQRLIIDFQSSADGRGFSLARHLRQRLKYQGLLYAAGEIIPDQVSMALDCGCDAVLVCAEQCQRYGEENWLASLSLPGHLSYWSHSSSGESEAWKRRAMLAK